MSVKDADYRCASNLWADTGCWKSNPRVCLHHAMDANNSPIVRCLQKPNISGAFGGLACRQVGALGATLGRSSSRDRPCSFLPMGARLARAVPAASNAMECKVCLLLQDDVRHEYSPGAVSLHYASRTAKWPSLICEHDASHHSRQPQRGH